MEHKKSSAFSALTTYYYIEYPKIIHISWDDDRFDFENLKNSNVFTTKKEAEKALERLTILRKPTNTESVSAKYRGKIYEALKKNNINYKVVHDDIKQIFIKYALEIAIKFEFSPDERQLFLKNEYERLDWLARSNNLLLKTEIMKLKNLCNTLKNK